MSKFIYEARDANGRMDTGVMTAGNVDEASRALRRDGKTVLSLRDEDVALSEYANSQHRKTRIKRDDIIYFANQLAVMVDT
ncbi:MAG: type II secretion system F family protein, partial [Planctomycetes bacterium]|nr:type II secretion system F family protein [Planctomycetota bacterium]